MTSAGTRAVDRLLVRARRLGVAAMIAFGILFSAMWLPFYLTRAEGQLLLYPIALFAGLIPMTSGVVGVVAAARAVAAPAAGSPAARQALVWLVLNAVMVVVPLPALWFGNAPVLLLGG